MYTYLVIEKGLECETNEIEITYSERNRERKKRSKLFTFQFKSFQGTEHT